MADVTVRQPVPLRTVRGIELAAVGTWKASTGTTTFTDADLSGAVAALDCPGVRNPVIKLGHQEPDATTGIRWDGEPAIGWVANMRFDSDGKLRGDLTGLPAWLADADENGLSVLAAAYPDRSIEIYRPFVCQIGHTHPSVICSLALTGVARPGVGVLKSMQDVYAVWTQTDAKTAASAALQTTVRTQIGDTMPAAVKASVSVEDISRKYYESAGYTRWITALHVDPLELIAADDADGKFYRIPVELKGEEFTFGDPQEVAIVYEDVKAAASALPYRWADRRAALSAQGIADLPPGVTFAPDGTASLPPIAPDVSPAGAAIRKMAAPAAKTPDASPAAGSTSTGKEEPGMANTPDPTKLREALGLAADASDDDVKAAMATLTSPAAPAAKPDAVPDPAALLAALPENAGVVVLDKSNYEALIAKADQGVQALAMARAGERDKVLDTAMRDGRFPPAKLSDYKAMWDRNPDATRDFITLLPKNSIPTQLTSGLLATEFDRSEADLAYEAVYGKEHVRG